MTNETPGLRPTVLDLCMQHIARLRAQRSSSATLTEAAVRHHLVGTALAATPAREATAEQFAGLFQDITAAGHGGAARLLQVQLEAAYVHAPFLRVNPMATVKDQSFDTPSDRELDRTKLEGVWRYLHIDTEAAPSIARRFVRLSLLLFGQRCTQLLATRVTDVDLERGQLRLWESKVQNPRPHLLPAGPAATAELRQLVQQAEMLGVLTLFQSGLTHQRLRGLEVGAVTRCLRRASIELQQQGQVGRPFGYLDLLRSVDSTGAQLGIPVDVRASLQSRVPEGFQSKFCRRTYLREKREALLMWEEFLASLLATSSSERRQPA